MFSKRIVSAASTLAVIAGLAIAAAPATATVTPPVPNPPLNAKCGLNFALILDSSGSIGTEGMENLKDASDAFTEALVDTGSMVSVTSFATQSPGYIDYNWPNPSPGQNLAPTALTSANLPTIQGSYGNLVSYGSTNWQDGFLKSQATFSGFAPATAPDLAVLITDGYPNTTNGGIGDPLGEAVKIANEMKNADVHMFGIGVGEGVNTSAIKAVTSDIELLADGSNFADAGFTTTTSYETLAKTLKKIAVQLCAPSLTITKVVTSADNPEPTPADGWTFATTITIPQGDGQWVKPGTDAITVGVPSTKSLATSQSGAANFQWLPDGELVTDPVIVKETQKVGYAVQPDLKCSARNVLEDTTRDFTTTLATDGTWNLGAIDPLEIVTCTATNVLKDTGSVKITKEFNAQGSGYAGTFDVAYKCVDGSDLIAEGTAALAAGESKTLSGLPTGTVCTVTEPTLPANPSGWTFNPPTFSPSNQATITTKGQEASVTVVNSVAQVSPVVVKKTCPINATLHKPQPKLMGTRILTDKITTKKSDCAMQKPVVLCRPLTATSAGETAFCTTKVSKKGKITVKTDGYDAVKVSVVVKVKAKVGSSDTWKGNTWRKSWKLK
ncbi:MAG: VWA domain-containing protein [Actinobacteria bacterium]|nr:VWA domain-containing protein [Actinomycetota bacterium]MCB0922094.1 VWA domain-containing protein [Actinomycetota bacterium]